MDNRLFLTWTKDLQSIAQAGLYYGKDVFDRERYEKIREISAQMMSEISDLDVGKVKDLFCNEIGYQTPKIDTRSAIFKMTGSFWSERKRYLVITWRMV